MKDWKIWLGVLVAIAGVGFMLFSNHARIREMESTIEQLQSERDRIQESNDALNTKIDKMKADHAATVQGLDERILEATAEAEAIKVASLQRIQAIRESVMKSWEERFDMLEQEYFVALEKINAQNAEIYTRNELVGELKSQVTMWTQMDLERRALMDDCTARLSESLDLNVLQAKRIRKLKRVLKIVGYIGAGIAGGIKNRS